MDPYADDFVLTDAESYAGGYGRREIRFEMPMTTLASTGLPDRTVPGGWLVDVKGSSTLAIPDRDGCAWPQQFEPDLTAYDEVPNRFGGTARWSARPTDSAASRAGTTRFGSR